MVRKVLIAAIMLPAIMWLHGETKTDFTETRYGIEMVYVEGGTFMMGCLPQENCSFLSPKPRNETVNSFYIGKYEVTQGQWADVMETDVRQYLYNARDGLPTYYSEGADYPMQYISWYDAVEFCNRLSERTGRKPAYNIDKTRKDPVNRANFDDKKWIVTLIPDANGYRLPMEAEWEYAARGGNKSRGYIYSGSNDIDEVAWYAGNWRSMNHPVGVKKANELGIHDMTGSVRERVFEWEDGGRFYRIGLTRVLRGSSWSANMELSSISKSGGGGTGRDIGFRLALSSK